MPSWPQPHEPQLQLQQLQQQLEGQQQRRENLKPTIRCLGMYLDPSSLYSIRFLESIF